MTLEIFLNCVEIIVLICFLYFIVQKVQCTELAKKCLEVLAGNEIEKIVISKIEDKRYQVEFSGKHEPENESKGVDLNESR